MPDKKSNNGIDNLLEVFNEYSVLMAVILIGAIAHVMVKIKEAREQEKVFNWKDFMVSFVIAIFSGMIFSLSAGAMGASGTQHGLAGAMGAFLGLTGLNQFTAYFVKKAIGNSQGNE